MTSEVGRPVGPGEMRCPLCGAGVRKAVSHLSEGETVYLNWGTSMHIAPEVLSWTLRPCGCVLCREEWTYVAWCESITDGAKPPYARYFWCHPDEVEELIRMLEQRS